MCAPRHILSLLALLVTSSALAFSTPPTEPWISHYGGGISWEHEKAQMDNFAIQILNDPNLIGYILIYSGADSCRGEAQARALRIKNYMVKVRGVPWNRVMWKDAGRYTGKGLEIFHLGFDRTVVRSPDFPYEPPPKGHVIPECRVKRDRR
jgi:hypothetical protein